MTEASNVKLFIGTEGAYQLAADIDQFLEDYDTYEYRDDVDDREENVRVIERDIYNGKTDYLKKDFNRTLMTIAILSKPR